MENSEIVKKSKTEMVKEHINAHKTEYITAAALIIGVGLGFCFGRKRSANKIVVYSEPVIDGGSCKIIGKFGEIDGEEFKSFDSLRKAKNLIGSTSDDVGGVALYYDPNGTTYAVAHGFEAYYGKK